MQGLEVEALGALWLNRPGPKNNYHNIVYKSATFIEEMRKLNKIYLRVNISLFIVPRL